MSSTDNMDLYGLNATDGSGTLILSEHVKLALNHGTKGSSNVLVMGACGTGKSSCYIEPNVRHMGSSFIVFDVSGDLYARTSADLRNSGYEVKKFDLNNPIDSCRYNPFNYIRNIYDVLTIARALTGNDTNYEFFYVGTEFTLLTALILYVYEKEPVEKQSLARISELLSVGMSDISQLDALFTQSYDRANTQLPAVKNYNMFRVNTEDVRRDVMTSLALKLAPFTDEMVVQLMSDDELDLARLCDTKQALFIAVPISTSRYDAIASLLCTQAERMVSDGETGNKIPLHIIVDEAGRFFIDALPISLRIGAKYNISWSLIVQSINQLIMLYGNVQLNIGAAVFLGSPCPSDCEYIAKQIRESTSSASDSTSYAGDLVSTEEILKMPNDKCIVLVSGQAPVYDRKYSWAHQMY